MINAILEKIRAAEAEAAEVLQKAVIRVQLIETDTQNKIEELKNEAAEELVKKIKKLDDKKHPVATDNADRKPVSVDEHKFNEAKQLIIKRFWEEYA